MSLAYHCPACRTTMNVHRERCRLAGTSIHDIEKCYTDIISVLSTRPHSRFDLLKETHGEWTDLHQQVFERLDDEGRIETIGEVEQEGGVWPVYKLRTAAEVMEQKEIPSDEHLHTIWEYGPVTGCRDNSLYAMTCYYQRAGFDWEDTRQLLLDWLDRVGQDGWDGESVERLVDQKKNVHEKGYHWGDKAREAAKIIDRSRS